MCINGLPWEKSSFEDVPNIKETRPLLSFSSSCKLQRNSLNVVNDCHGHDNVTDNSTMSRGVCL